MAEVPIPEGYGIPLVDLGTKLLPGQTMDALDDRYASGSTGGVTIDDVTASQTTVYSSSKTDSQIDAAVGGVTPSSIGAATEAQGALADSAVQPGDISTVAASGSYTDLSDKPIIPAAFSGAYSDLTGKPTLFSGAYTDLSDKPAIPTSPADLGAATAAQGAKADTALQSVTKASVGLDNVDNTSDASKPISTATQLALDGKAPSLPAGGTAVNFLRGDMSWAAPAGGGSSADVQVFNPSGAPGTQTSFTYTVPAGAKYLNVLMVAGGGGGGSGAVSDPGSTSSGGAGGGASATGLLTIVASLLPSSISVKVGAGGSKAYGRSGSPTGGNSGNGGGASQFDAYYVSGANGGSGGKIAADAPGGNGQWGFGSHESGPSGATGKNGSNGNNGNGPSNNSQGTSGSGGGGGGINGTSMRLGGSGGKSNVIQQTAANGGATDGAAGDNGTTYGYTGVGGAGGASSVVGDGGAGGDAGNYGAGGGGGGSALTGNSSGAGGNGGNGIIIVTALF